MKERHFFEKLYCSLYTVCAAIQGRKQTLCFNRVTIESELLYLKHDISELKLMARLIHSIYMGVCGLIN